MKGLLIKDLCILRNQKRILPIFLILTVWFTAMHTDGFAFPYLTMMSTILTVSTISYDEVDRSQTHLFTLPFDRRTYVAEKYLLGIAMLVASLLLAGACSGARQLIMHDVDLTDTGLSFALSICIGTLILSVMIPMRIRFGGDQGRIVLYTVFGVVALGIVALTRFLPKQAGQVTAFLTNSSKAAILSSVAVFVLILIAAGYFLSLHWIRKKEF